MSQSKDGNISKHLFYVLQLHMKKLESNSKVGMWMPTRQRVYYQLRTLERRSQI